jgi:hypothetical protein
MGQNKIIPVCLIDGDKIVNKNVMHFLGLHGRRVVMKMQIVQNREYLIEYPKDN